MTSFTDLLNKPVADIKAPVPLPVGTYLVMVTGQPEHKEVGKEKTDAYDFPIKFMSPGPDVDQEALLTSLDGTALTERKMNHRFFVTEASLHRLKEYLTDVLGIEDKGAGLGAMIPEAIGRQYYATIGHRPSDDGKQLFMDIKSSAKA